MEFMEQINIYDMLVFEDESGSLYYDCVCEIDQGDIFCNTFSIYQNLDEEDEDEKPTITIHSSLIRHSVHTFKLKEIWTRTDEDTYKKVYELVDGELTKISYSQGMKVYHRRQEVTYDQIKNFIVKDVESMGE